MILCDEQFGQSTLKHPATVACPGCPTPIVPNGPLRGTTCIDASQGRNSKGVACSFRPKGFSLQPLPRDQKTDKKVAQRSTHSIDPSWKISQCFWSEKCMWMPILVFIHLKNGCRNTTLVSITAPAGSPTGRRASATWWGRDKSHVWKSLSAIWSWRKKTCTFVCLWTWIMKALLLCHFSGKKANMLINVVVTPWTWEPGSSQNKCAHVKKRHV